MVSVSEKNPKLPGKAVQKQVHEEKGVLLPLGHNRNVSAQHPGSLLGAQRREERRAKICFHPLIIVSGCTVRSLSISCE
jgi:hypothetical protein